MHFCVGLRQPWQMLHIQDHKAPATQESNTCLITGFSLKTLAIKNVRCETKAWPAHIVSLCAPSGGILCGLNSSRVRFSSWKSSHCGDIVWVFIFLLDLELLEVFQLDLSFWFLATGKMIGFELDLFGRQLISCGWGFSEFSNYFEGLVSLERRELSSHRTFLRLWVVWIGYTWIRSTTLMSRTLKKKYHLSHR